MKRALRKLRPFDVVESFELNGEKFEVEWAQREVDCVLHEHGKLKMKLTNTQTDMTDISMSKYWQVGVKVWQNMQFCKIKPFLEDLYNVCKISEYKLA